MSFQFFLFGVFAFLFLSLVFTRNFCDEICFTKNNKLSYLSCCSVLLQHVCCFGFILYPPRSPQEVWRVWWVASCFWVRDPPKARFFPPAFSETTGVLRKLQNFSVCGADLFRVNRVYFRFSISALRLWHESMFNVIRRNPFFCKCSWSESTRGTAPFRTNNQAVKKSERFHIKF